MVLPTLFGPTSTLNRPGKAHEIASSAEARKPLTVTPLKYMSFAQTEQGFSTLTCEYCLIFPQGDAEHAAHSVSSCFVGSNARMMIAAVLWMCSQDALIDVQKGSSDSSP